MHFLQVFKFTFVSLVFIIGLGEDVKDLIYEKEQLAGFCMPVEVAATFEYFPVLVWIDFKHSSVLPKITFFTYIP